MNAEPHPNMPVLVGCGQIVRRPKETPLSPIEMMAEAARDAARDTHLSAFPWEAIDVVTVTRFVRDAPGMPHLPIGNYANPPLSLSRSLNIEPKRHFYGPTGGNSPQYLVNLIAEWIARGECETALLAGAECLDAIVRALKSGDVPDWNDDPGEARVDLGFEREGVTETERSHGIFEATTGYALFENALRGKAERGAKEHQARMGRLMAPFSEIAARHPQAWFPTARSAEEIATPSAENRYVGFPYTKYMNAVIRVNQGAALIMMSSAKARELGIPRERWIFLHGCADAMDIWHISERENLHASPAMRMMKRKAFDMAGWSLEDVDHMDIYSCFPSAVEMAQEAFGLAEDDPRALTVTGGLPYFGGAGNNYAMHGIATMMGKLRENPTRKGFCTANGYYITKHSMGLYSAEAPEGAWEREDPSSYQQEIDAGARVAVAERPQGRATLETWTVAHGRKGPEKAVVIGRLDESGQRFIANITPEAENFHDLMEKDIVARRGEVKPDPQREGRNLFTAD